MERLDELAEQIDQLIDIQDKAVYELLSKIFEGVCDGITENGD